MKPKLLLLHGALGSSKQLNSLKANLESQFEVYQLNFEGHGGNLSTKRFSIQGFTDNLKDFLLEKNIDSIEIFGYSMGGYVALNFAFQNPKMVKRIVTLGTKFNWSEESAAREVKMLNPTKIKEKVPHFANYLAQLHGKNNWEEVMNKTAQMMLDLSKGMALKEGDFNRIQHNVTIGWGSLDKMVSREESEMVSQLLPNARFVEISDFTHPLQEIDPLQLAEYIISSIKQV